MTKPAGRKVGKQHSSIFSKKHGRTVRCIFPALTPGQQAKLAKAQRQTLVA